MNSKAKIRSAALWIGGLLLVAIFVVGGYDLLGGKQDKAPLQVTEKVTIGVSATSFLPSLVHIAAVKGFFRDEGVDVEVKGFPTGRHALEAVLSGGLDIGTVAGPPIVLNSFKRNDFSIFATIVDSAKHSRVIARKDRNINTAKDMAGKKVGTTLGTTAHFFMHEFIALNGIDPSSFEVINLKPKQLVNAISKGTVDAIFAWEPNISRSRKALGDNAVLIPVMAGYKATFNLVARNDYIKSNPELIEKLLKAMLRAESFVKTNRDKSVDLVSSSVKADRNATNKLWDGYNFRLSLTQQLLIILEDQARWAKYSKLTDKKKAPNFLNYIYLDALKKVSPDKVTLIE